MLFLKEHLTEIHLNCLGIREYIHSFAYRKCACIL